jgi:hypothetical protein
MDRKPKPVPRGAEGPSRRAESFRLPRARLTVPFELSIADKSGTRFKARLASRDLSVSGAFLESSFFLPVGTRLEVCFQLDEHAGPLRAAAEIVRHEAGGRGGPGGFALRFFEFEAEARVAITELVLGESLRAFTARYLESRRARAFRSEADRMVDLLASWELHKATRGG